MLFPEELLVWWTKLRWIDTLPFQPVMWCFSSLLLRGKWFGTLTLWGELGLKNLYHVLQSGPSWSCLLAFWWERRSVKDKLSSVDSSLPSRWKELSRKIHPALAFEKAPALEVLLCSMDSLYFFTLTTTVITTLIIDINTKWWCQTVEILKNCMSYIIKMLIWFIRFLCCLFLIREMGKMEFS